MRSLTREKCTPLGGHFGGGYPPGRMVAARKQANRAGGGDLNAAFHRFTTISVRQKRVIFCKRLEEGHANLPHRPGDILFGERALAAERFEDTLQFISQIFKPRPTLSVPNTVEPGSESASWPRLRRVVASWRVRGIFRIGELAAPSARGGKLASSRHLKCGGQCLRGARFVDCHP